jgi:hypothetical protein
MVNLKALRLLATCLATLGVLSACGGSAPGASATPTPTPTPVTPTVPAADISVSFSPSNLDNSSVTKSDASIQVLDANRNVLKNAEVTVKVLDTSASWNASATNTGTTGVLTGAVNLGDNQSNREVTLLVNSGSVTKEAKLVVSGATLTATAPASVNTGNSVQITFRLRKNSQPLPNQSIQISSSLGTFSTQVKPMDAQGEYTFSYTTNVTGTDIISATAGGASVSTQIVVGAVVTPTPTPVSPASLGVQATPSVIQQGSPNSLITAAVKGASNQNIKDARVRFRIADPSTVGGSLNSTATVTMVDVYTDANGVATVTYYPGNKSGPTDGLAVCAQILNPTDNNPYPGVIPSNTDTRAGFCTNTNEGGVPLTVSVVPVSVTLGTNNLIGSGQGGLTYVKQYIVTVTNSSGAPQTNALVSTYLDVPRYYKGSMVWDTAIEPDAWVIASAIGCNNEDRNRNGVLDPGEDSADTGPYPSINGWSGNGNGVLDPRIPVVVRALNGGLTNASGFVTVEIEYPENYALWADVRLTVSTLVGGTEGRASIDLNLPALASDYTSAGVPPAGVVSPFGTSTATCRAP